jgi:uncharacterized protein with GYD domain
MRKAQELGIKVHGVYITLGRYDMVSVLEAPDERAILKLHAAYVGPKGRTRSETLAAISADEFGDIVKAL